MGQKLWLRNTENFMLFNACDPHFDPMTLILKLDLDMVVTYIHATNMVNRSKGLKSYDLHTGRQTDMCITFTYPLTWAAKRVKRHIKWSSVSDLSFCGVLIWEWFSQYCLSAILTSSYKLGHYTYMLIMNPLKLRQDVPVRH